MSKLKTVQVGALNIKTLPHSTDSYVDLFKKTYKKGGPAPILGTSWGTIGWLGNIIKGDPEQGLMGGIYRFLNIDPNEPWFNTRTKQRVDTDEEQRPDIPEHLKPHLRESFFAFYPKWHRLIYDSHRFAPSSAKRLLDNLFAQVKEQTDFNKIEVIVATDSMALENMLKVHRLVRLKMRFTRPNSDDLSREKKRIDERLVNQKVREVKQELVGEKGESIKPDNDTKALAELAQANGVVRVVGYDSLDERIEESTAKYPLTERFKYDSQLEEYVSQFIRYAERLAKRLKELG